MDPNRFRFSDGPLRCGIKRGALESLNETSPPDRAPDPVPFAPPGSDAGRGSKAAGAATPATPSAPAAPGEVGDALRSIYQRTIEESVPDEMIDLLGRLD